MEPKPAYGMPVITKIIPNHSAARGLRCASPVRLGHVMQERKITMRLIIFACTVLMLLQGCMQTRGGIRQPSLQGIDSNSGKILFEQSNALYKIDPKLHTDVLVAMVRAQLLTNLRTEDVSRITLSMLPIKEKSGFSCERFYELLSPPERHLVDEKMKDVPFVCKDKNYSIDNVLKSFPVALNPQINTPNIADNHWAWFGASGSSEPLKRILDNYISNPSACLKCLEWSYPSQASQNPDVQSFLEKYSNAQTPEVRAKLDKLKGK
jgi:hypothetical protein